MLDAIISLRHDALISCHDAADFAITIFSLFRCCRHVAFLHYVAATMFDDATDYYCCRRYFSIAFAVDFRHAALLTPYDSADAPPRRVAAMLTLMLLFRLFADAAAFRYRR